MSCQENKMALNCLRNQISQFVFLISDRSDIKHMEAVGVVASFDIREKQYTVDFNLATASSGQNLICEMFLQSQAVVLHHEIGYQRFGISCE